jgi:hypothetical protein
MLLLERLLQMDLEKIWDESFQQAVTEVTEKTGTAPDSWRVGGRASKANPDKENGTWWYANGKEMFQTFIDSWRNQKFQVWQAPDGNYGIEMEFNVMFGDSLIKAFPDAIVVMPTGELAVVDFKTGSYTPDSGMQLGLYASCIESVFGIRPTRGFFYSARKAEFIEVFDLNRWTIPVFTALFKDFNTALNNQIFLPNIGMACSTCGVADYCYAKGGQLAELYDPLTQTNKGE